MKNFISNLVVAAMVVSCGSSVKQVPTKGVANEKDAARLANNTANALQDATPNSARRDSVSESQSFSGNCATSGSVSGTVTISVNTSGGDAGALNGDIKFNAKDCVKTDAYEIDGSVDYSIDEDDSNSTDVSISLALNGTVAVVIYNDDGSVDQSADVTYNNLKWTVTETEGTNSTGGSCETVTATVSGTVNVGGTSYTPTGDDMAGTFGGEGTGTFTDCSRR